MQAVGTRGVAVHGHVRQLCVCVCVCVCMRGVSCKLWTTCGGKKNNQICGFSGAWKQHPETLLFSCSVTWNSNKPVSTKKPGHIHTHTYTYTHTHTHTHTQPHTATNTQITMHTCVSICIIYCTLVHPCMDLHIHSHCGPNHTCKMKFSESNADINMQQTVLTNIMATTCVCVSTKPSTTCKSYSCQMHNASVCKRTFLYAIVSTRSQIQHSPLLQKVVVQQRVSQP